MTKDISDFDGADLIDVREVIERVDELRLDLEGLKDDLETLRTQGEEVEGLDPDPADLQENQDAQDEIQIELTKLEALLSDLAGYGGDHQWEGDWYPLTLIADTYFVTAMQELVQDIGDLPRDLPGYLAIDWDTTANNLRVDYSSVDWEGTRYWYR